MSPIQQHKLSKQGSNTCKYIAETTQINYCAKKIDTTKKRNHFFEMVEGSFADPMDLQKDNQVGGTSNEA